MSKMLHSESRRLYSWWWDSHISPKNSKWLQENLTDMDIKIKAMIKLIEEDADSFARRAEMYYKKRPELMKMVEEFYRAYRALAERYDHATGALRQAHRTIAEAFPNQIPLMMPDESPNGSSTSVEPFTPEASASIHDSIGSDDFQRNPFSVPSHFHAVARNLAFSDVNDKESKHLNEMFDTRDEMPCAATPEGMANCHEESRQDTIINLQKQELGAKEDAEKELKSLRGKITELSAENQNLQGQLTSAMEQAKISENDFTRSKSVVSELQSVKEASDLQNKVFLTRISDLQSEISRIEKELSEFSCFRDRCPLLEKENQSLRSELEKLCWRAEYQESQINQKEDNISKLNILLKDVEEKHMHAEGAFKSMEKLHFESQQEVKFLTVAVRNRDEKLHDRDQNVQCLNDEVQILTEEIAQLREGSLSSSLLVKNFEAEIYCLKQAKQKLEIEAESLVKENEGYHLEICALEVERDYFKHDKQSLEKKLQVVSSNEDDLLMEIKELKEGTEMLKGTCKNYEAEKSSLMQSFEFLKNVTEKNSMLEKSLADSNDQKETLREKIKSLEDCYKSLKGEVSVHASEKSALTAQVETLSENMDNFLEKNTLLEIALKDANAELQKLRFKTIELEESNRSFSRHNSVLVSEKETLTSKVEDLGGRLDTLESSCAAIEDQISNLEQQKSSMGNQLQELEDLLRKENKNHEALIQSCNVERANFQSEINLKKKTVLFMEEKFAAEHERLTIADIEILILQRSLLDMEQSNSNLLIECQKHLEETWEAKKLVSKFQKDDLVLNKTIASLSEHSKRLRDGINELATVLNLNTELVVSDEPDDLILLHVVSDKLRDFVKHASDNQDGNDMSHVETTVLLTFLKALKLDFENLRSEKYFIERDLKARLEEILALENRNLELVAINGQLTRDLEVRYETEGELTSEIAALRHQMSRLEGSYNASQSENTELVERKEFLSRMLLVVQEENASFKKESDSIIAETMSLDILSLVLKNINTNQMLELMLCNSDREELLGEVTELSLRVSSLTEKLESSELENAHLSDSVVCLDEHKSLVVKLEDDLNIHRSLSEQQNLQLETQNHLLMQKDLELIELNRELNESRRNSEREMCNLIKENQLLSVKLQDLETKLVEVDEENNVSTQRAMAMDFLYVIFRNAYAEQTTEMKTLSDHLGCLHRENSDRNHEIRVMTEKLEALGSENVSKLNSIQTICSQLSLQNEAAKDLLAQKEIELSDVMQKAEIDKNLLQSEAQMLTQQNKLSLDTNCLLREKIGALDDQYCSLYAEAMTFELLHLIADGVHVDRAMELTSLTNDYNHLCDISFTLDQKVGAMNGKILGMESETSRLQESIANLEEHRGCITRDLRTSEDTISMLIEEKKSFLSKISQLREEESARETEDANIIAESIASDLLYLLFRCFSLERALELKLLSNHIAGLDIAKVALLEENEEIEMSQEESIDIEKSILRLDEHRRRFTVVEDDLMAATSTTERLSCELNAANNLLAQKDRELVAADMKFRSVEDKNAELHTRVEGLLSEISRTKLANEELEKNILNIAERSAYKDKEIAHLHEINKVLEAEHGRLHTEIDVLRTREESLTAEVQKGTDIIDRSEEETGKLLHDRQASVITAALLEERLLEAVFACESLEIGSMCHRETLNSEVTSMKALVDELLMKRHDLETESKALNTDLNAYAPLVVSLSHSIASLELNVGVLVKLVSEYNEENVTSQEDDSIGCSSVTDARGFTKLEQLLAKVEALQQVVAKTCDMVEQKRFFPKIKYGQQMKDIQLDQISSSSLRENGVDPYVPGRMESSETDDLMLELWETAERHCNGEKKKASLAAASEQDIVYHEIEAVEEEKSEYPSSELVPEKEPSVHNKLEMAPQKDHRELRQGWKKRVTERLGADFQRLSVLQGSIQELKKTMEFDMDKHGKKHSTGYKYDGLRAQLKEAEGAISHLVDVNGKLMQKAEDYSSTSSGSIKGERVGGDMGKNGRRQISEQARRGSEKIGELELELQKIQYIMLKLQEEHHDSRRAGTSDNSGILLRDFIYTRRGPSKHRSGSRFCGCMRPKTKDH